MPDALERKYRSAAHEFAWQYLFLASRSATDPRSGREGRHHLDEWAVQRAVKEAVREVGIDKHAGCHTLRHSFATHLLADGYDIGRFRSSWVTSKGFKPNFSSSLSRQPPRLMRSDEKHQDRRRQKLQIRKSAGRRGLSACEIAAVIVRSLPST